MNLFDDLEALAKRSARLLIDSNNTPLLVIPGDTGWQSIDPPPTLRLPITVRCTSTVLSAAQYFDMVWYYDTAGLAPRHWTYTEGDTGEKKFTFGMESLDAFTEFEARDFSAVAQEETIIWTCDVSGFDYVRESLYYERSRRAPAQTFQREPPFVQVGYAVLRKLGDTNPLGHLRRIFWLKDYDRGMPNASDGCYGREGSPCEAANPRAIVPGLPSSYTDRIYREAHVKGE